MNATYNITNDKLKVWFDARLSDADYAKITGAGFSFWRGSKCFAAKWSVRAEDCLRDFGLTIEEDDTPDDVEARVERFTNYADRAESAAGNAENYLNSDRANTERRRERAAASVERSLSEAEHWMRRIEASIGHARMKERPDVIARRIRELEADLRRYERLAAPPSSNPGERSEYQGNVSFWVSTGGRGGGWYPESAFPSMNAAAKRWIAHIENRLMYERACLAATDSLQAKMAEPGGGGVVIEVGGAISTDGARWLYVTKVNRSTVETYDHACHFQKFRKIDRTTIKEVASKMRVDAGEVLVIKAPVAEVAAVKAPTTARNGERPEKFGAFGTSPGFVDRADNLNWYLIVRVNARTVEYISKQTTTDGAGKESTRYFSGKKDIYGLKFLKTAAQVKAEMPGLLTDWERVQAIRARIAEKKAEAKSGQQVAA